MNLVKQKIEESVENLKQFLRAEEELKKIDAAAEWIVSALRAEKKLLICGNGGSAADAQHVAGEFIGRFYVNRRPLPAIALTTDSSVLTCVANDFSYEDIFSRQVEALGQGGDILLGISTNGSSKNVLKAFQSAKKLQIKTILLTGQVEREIASISDLVIKTPSRDTPRIQEMHLLIEHIISEIVDQKFSHEM